LGYPTEFLSLPQIQQRYGPAGIQDLAGNPALHSDDTQTSLAVARSLIQAGQDGVENWMAAFTQEFVTWLRSPENDRAPGNTTIKGCQNLESGVSWRTPVCRNLRAAARSCALLPSALLPQRSVGTPSCCMGFVFGDSRSPDGIGEC
jgi:ADP-ribosylglycohydrolase